MEALLAIATGVIAGVVSAALLFVSRTLIGGHLLPWYHDLVYRGINIDGEWHASSHEMAQDIRLRIKQRAGDIFGDADFERRPDYPTDIEDSRSFSVSGRIQDRYITLTLTHKNRQRIGVLAFLLEPVADGRQLRGVMSFVSIRSHEIDSVDVTFARDKPVVVALRESVEGTIEGLRRATYPQRRRSTRKSKKATTTVKPKPQAEVDSEISEAEMETEDRIKIE